MNPQLTKDILMRLLRIETKLVRGFEELGVNIDKDNEWLTLDEPNKVVYVATIGRSLTVLLSDMERAGAKHAGHHYDIVHRGNVVGTIVYTPLVYKP